AATDGEPEAVGVAHRLDVAALRVLRLPRLLVPAQSPSPALGEIAVAQPVDDRDLINTLGEPERQAVAVLARLVRAREPMAILVEIGDRELLAEYCVGGYRGPSVVE